MVMVKGCHKTVFGIERNRISSFPSGLFLTDIDVHFTAECQECAFHRIALNTPDSVMLS